MKDIYITMKINLKNKHTGALEQAPTGFSWTCFFCGGFVPLIRAGDIGTFFLHAILSLLTLGIYHLFFCSGYNKKYIKHLIMQGFVPADEMATNFLQMNGMYMAPTN